MQTRVAVRLTRQEQDAFARVFVTVSSVEILKMLIDSGCTEDDSWRVVGALQRTHREVMDTHHPEGITSQSSREMAS